MKSSGEEKFTKLVAEQGWDTPEPEYRFHPTRKWRFDFAWPDLKLALEVEGGTWAGGRHTRGAGYERDCEKYSHAAALGWKVMRFTSGQIGKPWMVGLVGMALDNAKVSM